MRQMHLHLLLALSVLVGGGLIPVFANTANRDAAGFLPVPSATDEANPAAAVAASTPVVTTNAAGDLTIATSYMLDDKHKLMPNDSLSFQIKEDRTNAMPLTVTESTELDIPYIGRMSVADKTCKQLADEVKVALEKEYYHHATVIIGLNVMGKVAGKVLVVGQVREPGSREIPANENYTASKAVMACRGFSDFAKKTAVEIVRKTPDGKSKTIKVNLENVLEKGRLDEDVKLEPDDLVIVPKRLFNL